MIEEDYKKVITLVRTGRIYDAIDILEEYNDEYFIKKLTNMVTPSERVAIVSQMEKMVSTGTCWIGISKNKEEKKSKTNNISLLEIFDILSNDDEAFFYPIHEEFEYNLVNTKQGFIGQYPVFISKPTTRCPFSGFNWHKEQLNLSIQAKIDGFIVFPDSVNNGIPMKKPTDLPNTLDTFQWKNYSLISNGELNITKLPISASLETLERLAEIGNFSTELLDSDSIYILDLSVFPLVNKNDISSPIYAKEMINLVIEDVVLSAKQKIFNSLYKSFKPDTPTIINGFNEKQSEYIIACGIKADGSYSPPTTTTNKEKTVDTVIFKIDVKGYSLIPSLNTLLEKEKESNGVIDKYTGPMLLAREALMEYSSKTLDKDNSYKLLWLLNKIKENKNRIKEIKKKVQKDKMNLLLSKTWFKDIGVSTAEQVFNIKTDKFPGKDNVDVVIRVHRQEIKK